MSEKTHSVSPIADDLSKFAVALSLPCMRCCYELKNLRAGGDCPECGEPIRITIIETVDPASRRLSVIKRPRAIGNAMIGIVLAFSLSAILSLLALLTQAPSNLPAATFAYVLPMYGLIWGAIVLGLLSIWCLKPMFGMCQRGELVGCLSGIRFTMLGLLFWSFSLLIAILFALNEKSTYSEFSILFDTFLPTLSAGCVFVGFKKLIPRLGQRSRAFRQAQGSRQRMNDLIAGLVFVLIGRIMIAAGGPDSNMEILGLTLFIMSSGLIVLGLLYLLRNTLWIRSALIEPPPALTSLLKSI